MQEARSGSSAARVRPDACSIVAGERERNPDLGDGGIYDMQYGEGQGGDGDDGGSYVHEGVAGISRTEPGSGTTDNSRQTMKE